MLFCFKLFAGRVPTHSLAITLLLVGGGHENQGKERQGKTVRGGLDVGVRSGHHRYRHRIRNGWVGYNCSKLGDYIRHRAITTDPTRGNETAQDSQEPAPFFFSSLHMHSNCIIFPPIGYNLIHLFYEKDADGDEASASADAQPYPANARGKRRDRRRARRAENVVALEEARPRRGSSERSLPADYTSDK